MHIPICTSKQIFASVSEVTSAIATGNFDWLAESLTDLGRSNRPCKRFTMSAPFFFNFSAVVDEDWSAMEMGVET